MKFFKGLVLVLIGLLVLFLLIGIFLPSQYRVERQVTINAPIDSVFNNALDLNTVLLWNPWTALDSAAVNTVTGTGNDIGDTWKWDGEIVGIGQMTNMEIDTNKSIIRKLEFTQPEMAASTIIWKFSEAQDGVRAVWINEGEAEYPMGRYFGLMMDSMLGSDFEKGLASLKALTEN